MITPDPLPAEAFIVDDDGTPVGHINFDKLTTDATLLMYELAATAGDDDATDRVAIEWTGRLTPEYFGIVSAAALSLTVRCILGPTLDACDRMGLDLRGGLQRAADNATTTLGGAR